MEKVTRRALFRQASVSVGLAGLVATTAACSTTGAAGATPSTGDAAATAAAAATTAASAAGQFSIPTEPIAIFITDPAKGTLLVVRGDSEMSVQNQTIVQTLLNLK